MSVAAPAPLWLFTDRPFAGLRLSAPRPLLRFEATIAGAILARSRSGTGTGGSPDAAEEFRAQVIARVAVAAFRSAVIRHRELRKRGETALPGIGQLIDAAFSVVRDQ
jgi:hypothetical protein